jgi:hypothetical protein
MIDVPTAVSIFSSATGGIKTAIEVVKSLRGSPSLTPGEAESVELATERMMAAEQALFDFKLRAFPLIEENAALKSRNRELEAFHTAREGLERRVFAQGASALVDKEVQPPYLNTVWYCEHCMNKGMKSPFNLDHRDFGFDVYHCPSCAAKIKVPNDLRAEVIMSGGRRTDFRGF